MSLPKKAKPDGTFPTIKEELEEVAHSEPYFQKLLDNLTLYERITGDDWEKSLDEYFTGSSQIDKGIAFGDFYENIVLERLENSK